WRPSSRSASRPSGTVDRRRSRGLTARGPRAYNPRPSAKRTSEIMAHHDSAKKRIRQTQRRTERNRARMSRVRTYFKKGELAISTGDKDAARQALIEAQPEIHRGVTRGVIHRNTAARKLSRLSARVKAL